MDDNGTVDAIVFQATDAARGAPIDLSVGNNIIKYGYINQVIILVLRVSSPPPALVITTAISD